MAIWILRPQENEQDVVPTDRGTRLYLPIANSTVNLCTLDDPEIMRSTLEGVFPNYDDQALASEVQVAWAFTHWL